VIVAAMTCATIAGSTQSAHATAPCSVHASSSNCADQGFQRTVSTSCPIHLLHFDHTTAGNHGNATGTFEVWKHAQGELVTGGCRGTSNGWTLSNNGWVSDTILL